jgi:hypothetical protein
MDKPYIYVASSWRNTVQPRVVATLRDEGFGVYDFRHPASGEKGFAFSDIDPDWDHEHSDPLEFIDALNSAKATKGFGRDYEAMQRASIFVLVLPCGHDAHLELGWAAGAGKETVILLDDPCKASLMYKLADHLSPSIDDLVEWLRV